MRRLIWQMMLSLDGFMEGPNHELDWHVIDEDYDRYGAKLLSEVDGMVLGRVTYEVFAAYWPTATQPEARRLNELPKYVFTRTLKEASWNNSTLLGTDAVGEMQRLKAEPGGDLVLFGSADLASTFTKANLIDEYRILVAPVVLGAGTSMFKHLDARKQLKLKQTQTFSSGVLLNTYVSV